MLKAVRLTHTHTPHHLPHQNRHGNPFYWHGCLHLVCQLPLNHWLLRAVARLSIDEPETWQAQMKKQLNLWLLQLSTKQLNMHFQVRASETVKDFTSLLLHPCHFMDKHNCFIDVSNQKR